MSLGRWYRTLQDIPPRQLLARLNFEAKKTVFPKLPANLRWQLSTRQSPCSPPLRHNYLAHLIAASQNKPVSDLKVGSYEFTFLNETRSLSLPITWNSPDYSRLWQFNLHYFDWIREDIEAVYQHPEFYGEQLQKISTCIKDWIAANPLWSFDGWHPYTTSLRIVNWTFAIHTFPELATPQVLNNLWQQVCFLDRNKEFFAGGNHLLENLRALIIGGLNFDDSQAQRIVQKALDLLEEQLQIQILKDGGHYELSPMYHLIVINLVGECMVCLQSAGQSIPATISSALNQMLDFLEAIRLQDGQYPLWNDCAYNVAPSLNSTRDWIRPLCGQPRISKLPELQARLLQSANIEALEAQSSLPETSSSHLASSGYHILRQGNLEVTFDCASPCPKELPPHAHADCLSTDVYWQGQPVMVETGTSQYGSGPIRSYERSTQAHNTIALSSSSDREGTAKLDFMSQSEIWSSFRVGRKAQPFGQNWGHDQCWQWTQAGHDGYLRMTFQTSHHRWIGISENIVVVLDHLAATPTKTRSAIRWRSHFHLAPGIQLSSAATSTKFMGKLDEHSIYMQLVGTTQQDQVDVFSPATSVSWYAPEFGKRLPRSLLQIEGWLQPTHRFLGLVLGIGESPNLTWHMRNAHLSLAISQKGIIDCCWRKNRLSTTISY